MGGIPSLGHSGSTIAAWTIIEELLESGHEVTAILLPERSLVDETGPDRLAALERLGVAVRLIEIPGAPADDRRWRRRLAFARSLAWPGDDELFPSARAGKAVQDTLEAERVEAGIAFAFEAIAATWSRRTIPLLALLSHPPGVSRRVRVRYGPSGGRVWRASQRSFLLHADRRASRMLQAFPSVGVFSREHSTWARKHGVNAWYAHYPMPDLAGPHWRERRSNAGPGGRPKILMIGHLRGIGTISGLHLFVPSILPRLTEALGSDGFEVHLVGGHEPPLEFAEGLRHPAVQVRGQIIDPAEEFFDADVLLAPNPTTTGASARILSGLTFGNCIVAHTDSLVGIPELVDDENCLLAADGAGLADKTLRALGNPELRDRLGSNARRLYERSFSPPVAAAEIVRELERLRAAVH